MSKCNVHTLSPHFPVSPGFICHCSKRQHSQRGPTHVCPNGRPTLLILHFSSPTFLSHLPMTHLPAFRVSACPAWAHTCMSGCQSPRRPLGEAGTKMHNSERKGGGQGGGWEEGGDNKGRREGGGRKEEDRCVCGMQGRRSMTVRGEGGREEGGRRAGTTRE